MSLRRRLLLVSLATLAVGLGALLVLGNILLDRTVGGVTTRLLHLRAQAQVESLIVSGTGVQARGGGNDQALDEQAWILSRGRVIERAAGVPSALDRFAVAFGHRGRAGETQGPSGERLLAQPLIASGTHRIVGMVVVGVSSAPFSQLTHKVLIGSLAIAALILAAGALAIHRALLGALRPVRLMTADAENWGAHDLDRRFGLGTPRDELTGLAMTLDHLLERIAASRRHEQRFAGDVAHELRTPLSIIRGHTELALDDRAPGSREELRTALSAIASQADLMSVTVESLLAIARSEIDPQAGTADLRALLEGFDGVDVRVHGAVPRAEGDPEIVRRALAPLIDNARRHARHHVSVELAYSDGRARATVCDDGEGLDPDLGEAAFEPGRRGTHEPAGGAGLGLALARRLARACGGEVSIGPGPGGCFVLELPAESDPARRG